MKPILAPSLMCMDLGDMQNQMRLFNKYGNLLHVDIMDGHFAKNITLSPMFIKAIKPFASIPIEAHLMVTNPEDYIETLIEYGVDIITLHAETIVTEAFRIVKKLQKHSVKVGIALCPATPVNAILEYAAELDFLTIMTVDIGYSGQQFIPQMLAKIKLAEKTRLGGNFNFVIQVDGAIGNDKLKPLYDAGARAFVMGSTGLFKQGIGLEAAFLELENELKNIQA